MSLIRRDTKSIMFFALKMVGVWLIAYTIFVFFRNYGITDSEHYQSAGQVNLRSLSKMVLFFSILTGIFYTGLEIFFDRPIFQKIPFGRVILVKTILYVIMMRVLFFLAALFYFRTQGIHIDFELVKEAMTGKIFWALLFYFLLVTALISFVRQVSQKFGPGMLWNFLIGKYHKPKEEERIFLFIDLHSSTTHAETLGHLKFSSLLQDCFFDLTDVVTNNHVDVYQYVGDEAVLCWKKKDGLTNKRCLRAYFDYMQILNNRKEYYLENYGLQPYFKAGLHMGKVTVAEVGVVKKEIAYHGDVLNTTARIQGECNKHGQSLLASEAIVTSVPEDQQFKYKLIDSTILKGKLKKVNIYSIKPSIV